MKPLDLRPVGDKELLIAWEDGHRTLLANTYLQLQCRCARCVNELTGERMITETDIDPDVKITGIEPVGHYGVKFQWSSGCQTGIFSFDYLRALG